ncbi:hypothetical protein E1B28_008118 [Marasmius oreades]|uniref:NADH:flavin oxidoreductase/NADH oxidase N-terminal domain-containing protein n=1 Tax=Marasmius oreades TaxID=181124 RepID=A0A9P7RYE3_9AGAR|nr:uncharacterized protein E1B28_008118 [Marasmius oreades]KAG7091717.1 hypothetical protein E1B28_008118 [Marasmius oreades]
MCMEDPTPTFAYLVKQLKDRFPTLSYVHLIEPMAKGPEYTEGPSHPDASNDVLREIWGERPFIRAGRFDREKAIVLVEDSAKDGRVELVAFGKYFISNPDLPTRLEKGIPLTPYDRSTFYLRGETTTRGYTDYPFAGVDSRM